MLLNKRASVVLSLNASESKGKIGKFRFGVACLRSRNSDVLDHLVSVELLFRRIPVDASVEIHDLVSVSSTYLGDQEGLHLLRQSINVYLLFEDNRVYFTVRSAPDDVAIQTEAP